MHNRLTWKSPIILTLGLLTAAMVGCTTPKGDTPAERRAHVRDMADQTLAELYARRPEAQRKIQQAAGYGVFSNIGTKIIFVATGGGYGLVHDNKIGSDTYMRMGELGVGLGLGVKDFRAVFVFHTPWVLDRFITSGWEWGAEADAALKSGDRGAAASAAGSARDDIEVYQFTEAGIVLGATLSGTKYWPDRELN